MVGSRLPAWPLAALLALLTMAVYWPATQHDFIGLDDPDYVTSNLHVQAGMTLENVEWAFVNPVSANWHPVTMLSLMLDSDLFGLKPWGYHLTNLLLHALNTALVFLLLRNLTGAIWRSALVAALFGLHPLHVESVAWVAERKDVLSTFFGLLALLAYARYAREQGAGSKEQEAIQNRSAFSFLLSPFYWLSLSFFTLGLMSKSMLVTWPFVMLLLDYWPLERFTNYELRITNFRSVLSLVTRHRSLLWEKIPFLVLAVAASAVTLAVQQQGGAVITVGDYPLDARIGNALISYCRYLGKIFWPADLAVFYPYPGYWPLAAVLLAGALLCGISVLLFLGRRRYPFLLVGWLWFVGTLVPVIGLVQVGEQSMADRYAYIPSLGLLVLVVWGAFELGGSRRYHAAASVATGSAAIMLCLLLTRHQLGYWQNSETLFRHTLGVTRNNELAQNNLGNALLNRGQFDEAISHFQEAIRIKPSAAEIHGNLGVAFLNHGQTDGAIEQFQEAIGLKPSFVNAYMNLGLALFKHGDNDEAITEFQKAITLKPDFVEAHINLGVTLLDQGRTDEAMGQFQEAIRLKPDNADAHYNLGVAFLNQGRADEAIRQFQETLRLDPGDPDVRGKLAKAMELKGKLDLMRPTLHP